MRLLGIALMVIGALIVGAAMMMDVTVSSGLGRVTNIGLLADRQNYITIGGMVSLAGLSITLFSLQKNAHAGQDGSMRACPACAETIRVEAVKCRFCGEEVGPVTESPAPSGPVEFGWLVAIPCRNPAELERANAVIQSLGLPSRKSDGVRAFAGPFSGKSQAGDALRLLITEHKLDGNIEWFAP